MNSEQLQSGSAEVSNWQSVDEFAADMILYNLRYDGEQTIGVTMTFLTLVPPTPFTGPEPGADAHLQTTARVRLPLSRFKDMVDFSIQQYEQIFGEHPPRLNEQPNEAGDGTP